MRRIMRSSRFARTFGGARHFAASLSFVFLDQISKYLVARFLPVGGRIKVIGPLAITHVRNEGGAFGMFQGSPVGLGLLGIGLLCAVALWWWFDSSAVRSLWGLAFLASGSVGNLIDRLARGAVVDFIDLGFWPVFNAADSFILTGVVVLAWTVVSGTRRADDTIGV
jgi:signal peptidase II